MTMKAITNAMLLCCSIGCLPKTLSLISLPSTGVRRAAATHAQWCAMSRVRPDTCLAGCSKHRNYGTFRARGGHRPCFSRKWRSETHERPPGSTSRRGSTTRSKNLSTCFMSSTASEDRFDQDEPLSFEDFEKALRLNAPHEDGRGDSAAGTRINWWLLTEDILAQPIFFGVFYLLATPAIRENVKSSFQVTLSGTCLGVLGSLPLFAYGLALQKRRDWAWVRRAQAKTEQVVLELFGSARQVTKVTAVSIPLTVLVGISEECGLRGFLPLILAAKTGLPMAAVVVVSGVFCGLLHAVSVSYFINAALNGMFFHGLLLFTGNIWVPIVAHAVHNSFVLVRCHLKTSRPR